jgi:hypothetical protein
MVEQNGAPHEEVATRVELLPVKGRPGNVMEIRRRGNGCRFSDRR